MKKKILFFGYNKSGFGGMETVCRNVYFLLKAHNPALDIEFVFISDFRHGCQQINDDWLEGIPFCRITSGVYNTKIRRIHFAYRFAKIIKTTSPDIVIALETLNCYIATMAKKFTVKPFVLYSWLHNPLDKLYRGKYSTRADYHLAISSGIAKQLMQLGIDQRKIFTIYNPTQPCDDVINRPFSPAVFIYVGRLENYQKNIHEILHALSQTTGNYQLHVVGSGEDEQELKQAASDLNIHVQWHGWQSDPWGYIKNTIKEVTALLLSSNFEGFPMILGEAMARGIYCVSADCLTGPADIINENNGELYPLHDVAALTHILQAIMHGKPLPDHETIKQSINPLYADKYIEKLVAALQIH